MCAKHGPGKVQIIQGKYELFQALWSKGILAIAKNCTNVAQHGTNIVCLIGHNIDISLVPFRVSHEILLAWCAQIYSYKLG